MKVFTARGEKADADLEALITASVRDASPALTAPSGAAPRVERGGLADAYVEHTAGILRAAPVPAGFGIAVDCANGATSRIAPAVLRRLGLEPTVLHDSPDGRNINRGCGSTHPGRLARAVVELGCELGAAFDGDGDRVVLVDNRGGGRVRRRGAAGRRPLARGARPPPPSRGRGHRDEQHRARAGPRRRRHRVASLAAVGDRMVRAEMRVVAGSPWAESSRATSSSPSTCRRETGSPRP